MAIRLSTRSATTSASAEPRNQIRSFLLSVPALLWLGLFFILPLIFILIISFLTRGSAGTVTLPFTTAAYERVFGVFSPVLISSIQIAALTTLICVLVGFPMAFFIKTRKSATVRGLAMFLVILPFWTNFIVRIYAWRVLLGPEGTINSFLINAGLIQEPIQLLYNEFAVLVGLVYGFLPFMVLPIYSSLERFDYHLVEAAHDLGANNWHTFWRVYLPLVLPGVIAGSILVFIPAIGSYVVPDMLGGTSGLMIGNLIHNQFRGSGGNLPLGSALSIVLMGIVLLSLIVYVVFGDKEN